jgi:hypothetical protein
MRTLLGRGTGTRLMLLAVAATALAACAGSSAATAGPATGAFGGATEDQTNSGAYPDAYPAASAAPSVAAAQAPSDGSSQPGTDLAQIDSNLQIVYTGSLQLVVADVEQALAKAKTAVAASGGYIGASQETNNADQPTAVITYRIPATRWEDTIAALRGLATKVVAEETQAQEVGSQVVDLQARIANLRASEAALQAIAQNTAKVSDLLDVQSQLTDVRGQIEQLDAQEKRLSDQVAYGTLVTTFGLEVQQVQTAAKGWDPGADVDGATAAMISLGQRLASGAIWFAIVWLPLLIVALVVLFVLWKVARRVTPKVIAPPPGPIAGWKGDAPPEA